MTPEVDPIPAGRPSFLDLPRCENLDRLEADVAFVAIPYTPPYDLVRSRMPSSLAPAALREQSLRLAGGRLEHYDFEFGGPLFAGRRVQMVDCGDVHMLPGQYEANGQMATAVVRRILERGALPIILGGDHATTIPVMRAYEGRGPICAVHVDAHLDWRDEINGVHDGLSSPMRRASELPWVTGMIQIGLRGVGSARQREVDDAANWGSVRVRAEDVHAGGLEPVMAQVPEAEYYYISVDCDVLDPGIAPGVNSIAFGGLSYFQVTNVLRGIARKGKVVGMDFVEVAPANDVHNLTSLMGARLILNLLGELAHQGQLGQT